MCTLLSIYMLSPYRFDFCCTPIIRMMFHQQRNTLPTRKCKNVCAIFIDGRIYKCVCSLCGRVGIFRSQNVPSVHNDVRFKSVNFLVGLVVVVAGVNYIKRGRINEIIDAFTRFIFKEIRYHTTNVCSTRG